ncbi:MAG TPA: Na+/H+ antiporter subunit E [Ilumatobacteraceae bacterium]|nr:Na+/H+ antiporter subunit E [Ilumatobacteraceae bacterium]
MGRVRRTTIVQAVSLFAFWFALSGRTEPLFLVTGAVAAVVVTALTSGIVGVCLRPDGDRVAIERVPLAVVRAVAFAVWMAGRILVASVQLARIVLSPRMPLDPCSVRFRTELHSPLARATLANSISLVPGTLTVDIDGQELLVHALSPAQVQDLVSGRLQNKIAGIFLEGPQPPLDLDLVNRGELS